MSARSRLRRVLAGGLALVVTAVAGQTVALAAADAAPAGITNIVVIYAENHSFDNLFGGWEGVDGLDAAPPDRTVQVDADGRPLRCLPQNDVNLPPVRPDCTGGAFRNAPFRIEDHIRPGDTTCPVPGRPARPNGWPKGTGAAGGCTEDLVHRFYQEQYQIHGGRQDRYVTGSDALGLVMGHYDTPALPIYRYLHSAGAPRYTIADRFFQAAFGGSFLNHQWLVAARTPRWTDRRTAAGKNSIVDAHGMPAYYPLHPPADPAHPAGLRDGPLTQAPEADGSCRVAVCGDHAVNTVQPRYPPYRPGTPDAQRLPALTYDTIGDRLSARNVDWAWYAGGWDNASGRVGGAGWTNGADGTSCTDPRTMPGAAYPNCPDVTFQFHHQPFSYFARYAPGTPARAAHLRDEVEFVAAAKAGRLKPVSFVKPVGAENEHPGYASVATGNDHLVELLRAIQGGGQAAHTLVVVTYDEFGGQWDHVPPPKGDVWGPGTRVPALLISPGLPEPFAVDHTTYDTTSVLATIERMFHLAPLSGRDAAAASLAGSRPERGGTGGGPPGHRSTAVVVGGVLLVAGGAVGLLVARRRRAWPPSTRGRSGVR
ncbi:acid phosphatase [Micromonospora sp. R77]|uniref:acid phosphatase n=1 Tax=Micromonospora sp. R77 TaxID=2925836 RepID=UPI001F60C50D|nr:acid phosphatase [Micromonospora sp. R77]MCI4066935.1 acid phosphatase [Micromonospora sp. R77]